MTFVHTVPTYLVLRYCRQPVIDTVRRYHRPSRDIVFRNITTGGGYGLTIGSETSGDVINVTFENINVSTETFMTLQGSVLFPCSHWNSLLAHADAGEPSDGWDPHQVTAWPWGNHNEHHIQEHHDEQRPAVHLGRCGRQWLQQDGTSACLQHPF